jgi:hypothetical protein
MKRHERKNALIRQICLTGPAQLQQTIHNPDEETIRFLIELKEKKYVSGMTINDSKVVFHPHRDLYKLNTKGGFNAKTQKELVLESLKIIENRQENGFTYLPGILEELGVDEDHFLMEDVLNFMLEHKLISTMNYKWDVRVLPKGVHLTNEGYDKLLELHTQPASIVFNNNGPNYGNQSAGSSGAQQIHGGINPQSSTKIEAISENKRATIMGINPKWFWAFWVPLAIAIIGLIIEKAWFK